MPSADDIQSELRARIAAIEGTHTHANTDAKFVADNTARRIEKKHVYLDEDESELCHKRRGLDANEDEAQRAFRKIERLSLMREQASSALEKRLIREGFSEEATTQAVRRARACGLVDDMRFAETLMRCRAAAGRGRRGIESELAALDIEASDVPGWPEEFVGGEDDELARALSLLERRPPHAKNLREAAYRRLVQKGYSSSTAASAARRFAEAAVDD